jgi:EpsD family peptidyl-prolyl cis-trans isomerase
MIFALSLALIASGCDRKAEGQTVAVVNGEEITANELNAELANANVPADADKKLVTARVLQTMIDRRLLSQQAREENLDKSPEFLSRQRRLTEDLLIGMLAQRQMNTAQLPAAAELTQFQTSRPQMFAQRQLWNLEQLQYPTPADARVQQRISGTKTLDELANVLTQAGVAFQRSRNRIDTAVIPSDMYRRIVALPQGEPFIVPAGGRSIASVVVAREPAPLAGANARPVAVAAIRRENGAKFMEDRVKSLRQAAKIEYKEGYGPAPQQAQAK